MYISRIDLSSVALKPKYMNRNSKIPKGQTEIVSRKTDKTMVNTMKRKTNIQFVNRYP